MYWLAETRLAQNTLNYLNICSITLEHIGFCDLILWELSVLVCAQDTPACPRTLHERDSLYLHEHMIFHCICTITWKDGRKVAFRTSLYDFRSRFSYFAFRSRFSYLDESPESSNFRERTVGYRVCSLHGGKSQAYIYIYIYIYAYIYIYICTCTHI